MQGLLTQHRTHSLTTEVLVAALTSLSFLLPTLLILRPGQGWTRLNSHKVARLMLILRAVCDGYGRLDLEQRRKLRLTVSLRTLSLSGVLLELAFQVSLVDRGLLICVLSERASVFRVGVFDLNRDLAWTVDPL